MRRRRYRPALETYRRLHALLARLVSRSVSDRAARALPHADVTEQLLAAAVEAGQLGVEKGWDARRASCRPPSLRASGSDCSSRLVGGGEHIPAGMISALVGRPGQGKSLMALHVAAELSRQAAVLVSSSEDPLAELAVPRGLAAVAAAAGDPGRIFFERGRLPALPAGLERWAARIAELDLKADRGRPDRLPPDTAARRRPGRSGWAEASWAPTANAPTATVTAKVAFRA